MDFMLSRATRVTAQWASAPVQHAVARFWRDMEMTLSTTSFVPDNRLMICLAPRPAAGKLYAGCDGKPAHPLRGG